MCDPIWRLNIPEAVWRLRSASCYIRVTLLYFGNGKRHKPVVEEKEVAFVFDAMSFGGDGTVADEHVSEPALEVSSPPLPWKRAHNLFPYTRNR